MESMKITGDEAKDEAYPVADTPKGERYPYGLCISLSERELEKLGLPDDPDIGDVLHLTALAKVTHVSKSKGEGNESHVHIELQITHMAVEDEDEDDEPDDEDAE